MTDSSSIVNSRGDDYALVESMVLELLRKLENVFPENEIALIKEATEVASVAHDGQYRKSGELYVTHPLRSAIIAAGLGFDYEVIAATVLHDVLEDTKVTSIELEYRFGSKITDLVEGVTKVSDLKNKRKQINADRLSGDQFRKMVVALAADRRVLMVKIVDRLDNLRTINFLDGIKASAIGKETLEVYVPLAQRMGLNGVLTELEDLAFKAYNPELYSRVVLELDNYFKSRKKIELVLDAIVEGLNYKNDESLNSFAVEGRHKSAWSSWLKSQRMNVPISSLQDLVGVRIVCKSKLDCYIILGKIHELWKPVPGTFDDYIASPKYNTYQSLHTQIIIPSYGAVEVQIRSEDMHKSAEEGRASHYSYKHSEDPTWIESLLQLDTEETDYLENIKQDLVSKRVYALTPKGDLIDLPQGSNVLDFAYSVHSEIGAKCEGAYIDGVRHGKGSVLKSGDIVNVTVNKKKVTHENFYGFYCKTSKARNGVRKLNKSILKLTNRPKEVRYKIKLTCEDYPGILLETVTCLHTNKSNIVESKSYKIDEWAFQEFDIESSNTKILEELSKVRGVKRIEVLP